MSTATPVKMPPKRGPKPNAYLLFLRDQVKTNPDYHGRDTKELVDLLAPVWNAMGEEDKNKYKQKAKEARDNQKVSCLCISVLFMLYLMSGCISSRLVTTTACPPSATHPLPPPPLS